MLIAATSGISRDHRTDGSIDQQLPEDETGWLVAEVSLRDTLTVAGSGTVELLPAGPPSPPWWGVVVLRSRRRRSDAIA